MQPQQHGAHAQPSDHTTLTEILDQFAAGGFGGDFRVAEGGSAVQCLTCEEETSASDIPQHSIRRLEGASDPDDMVVVVAITCPRCGARGTLIAPFGPNASASEALVLTALRDARSEDVAPQNSAPGETIGDGASTGHDALPGEAAPAFSAPSSTGRSLSLDDFLGKVPVALTFTGTLSPSSTDDVIESFDRSLRDFGRQRVQSLLVVPQSEETVRRRRRTGTNVPLLADEDGQLLNMYAPSATFPISVLVDEEGTVTRLVEGGVADEHVAAVVQVAEDSTTSPKHRD